jgi:hypothetical protein
MPSEEQPVEDRGGDIEENSKEIEEPEISSLGTSSEIRIIE